jgi:hypothetical protein
MASNYDKQIIKFHAQLSVRLHKNSMRLVETKQESRLQLR